MNFEDSHVRLSKWKTCFLHVWTHNQENQTFTLNVLIAYSDSRCGGRDDDTREWEEAHADDILGLAAFQHSGGVNIVASSSYDGDIFIWSLETGAVVENAVCSLYSQACSKSIGVKGKTWLLNFIDPFSYMYKI